jgi:putative transposase
MLAMLAGWINRHQQDVIEYLKTENAILRAKFGKKRIILTDDQKRLLAVSGKKLGRKVLSEICCAFSPDTILKWHRKLIAAKYDGSRNKKLGRPRISEELEALVIKIAKYNRSWGYVRIAGQLKYLGYKISHATIADILKKNSLEPSPDRLKKTTWKEFIKSHWESLAAIDFFTTEIYTLKGLTRYMILVVIDYSTRKVEVAGIIQQAYGDWMKQMAKNLTDPLSGFLKGRVYLIHDRDPLFTDAFRKMLEAANVKTVRTPPMAPNLTPVVERFIRSIKSECLGRMLIFGEAHLRYCIEQYCLHYHHERPHQGLNNNMIEPPPQGSGEIICRERIGGLLKSYRRAA